jgi:hypothetical protein
MGCDFMWTEDVGSAIKSSGNSNSNGMATGRSFFVKNPISGNAVP